MYSYGPPHMAEQKQDDQHEHTFSNYVRIRDVVQKTFLGRWTIGKSGERGSGISVLPARQDDDDDCNVAVYYVCLNITRLPSKIYLIHRLGLFNSKYLLFYKDESLKRFLRLVIIIIILSCHQHGFPWPSLATPPYRSSLPVGRSGLHPASSQSCCM